MKTPYGFILSVLLSTLYFLQKFLFDRSIRERNSTVSFLNLAKLLLIENFVQLFLQVNN